MDGIRRTLHEITLIILISQMSSPSKSIVGPKTVLGPKIHGVYSCPRSENHYLEVFNFSILSDSHGMDMLNAHGRITRAIKIVTKAAMKLHRCRGGFSRSNCESFTNFVWDKDGCNMIAKQGVFWTPTVDSITPKFHCPMAAV